MNQKNFQYLIDYFKYTMYIKTRAILIAYKLKYHNRNIHTSFFSETLGCYEENLLKL